jgi:hypothetical protein
MNLRSILAVMSLLWRQGPPAGMDIRAYALGRDKP